MSGGGLKELEFEPGYDTAADALTQFYVPALERATSYSRSAGYFRSSSLAVAARGLSRFIAGAGRMKLLVGTDLTNEDCSAILGGTEIPESLANRLAAGLAPASDLEQHRLEVLAWLARERRLFVQVAYPVDDDGQPIPGDFGYFHEKIGILTDAVGDGVAFVGSVNETAAGWTRNFESFSVHTSWNDWRHYSHWTEAFNRRWAGRVPGWRVAKLPQAVMDRLVALSPTSPPSARDLEEPPELGEPGTVAAWLRAAPTLVGAERLAEATSAVTPFPHQRQVAERLAGEYPRSWLVADEVGLGKTISAGLALRRLLLTRQAQRVLILAPASVCIQWQDELFEKFGIWADRLDGTWWRRPHRADDEQRHADSNPYTERDLLIVSSHLARREEHQRLLLDADPWDLVIVDEAHHARRKREADPAVYRPGRLLELLDQLGEAGAARATWLLTATPMQVDPIELHDLLRHVDLSGSLGEYQVFAKWYEQLAPGRSPTWQWFHDTLRTSPSPPWGTAEQAVLDDVDFRFGPVARRTFERFGVDDIADADELVAELPAGAEAAFRGWVKLRGPVGRCVTRHSRTTLKQYRDAGLLDEPIADRDVQSVPIGFSAEEEHLYKELDRLLDRLLEAHGTRRGAGFVLTVYRRRLTSSWDAIRRTLERRMHDLDDGALSDDLYEEAETEGISGGVDPVEAVPLSDDDIDEIRRFIAAIGAIDDTKFRRLKEDLDDARSAGRASIVFTQFFDTLDGLRDRLRGVYTSELATFTGDGGRRWSRAINDWESMSKQELVEAVRSGEITVLLATDAASEGLNLQACSFLVNYDMPWNPMRAEQRIGRIDRIGQTADRVIVRNYFIPGTVEERVYELLADRIDDFSDLLGDLQPILGATEDAFRATFRAPRSERERIEREQIAELDRRIAELRQGGVEINAEDKMPIPEHPEPPVDLERLGTLLRHCGIRLGSPDRPTTSDRDGASRDQQDWRALATYLHPDLDAELHRVADEDTGALVIDTVVEDDIVVSSARRADRIPPATVTTDELGDLGPVVSAVEARQIARDEARTVAHSRLDHRNATVRARATRSERAIVRRFIDLAHRLIAAEAERGRRSGGTTEPLVVWFDLTSDSATGWNYAKRFAELLDLTVNEIAPGHLADPGAVKPGDADRFDRHTAFAELSVIMTDWKALHESLG